MSEEEKQQWKLMAEQEKEKHRQTFPNYKYSPRPRRTKKPKIRYETAEVVELIIHTDDTSVPASAVLLAPPSPLAPAVFSVPASPVYPAFPASPAFPAPPAFLAFPVFPASLAPAVSLAPSSPPVSPAPASPPSYLVSPASPPVSPAHTSRPVSPVPASPTCPAFPAPSASTALSMSSLLSLFHDLMGLDLSLDLDAVDLDVIDSVMSDESHVLVTSAEVEDSADSPVSS